MRSSQFERKNATTCTRGSKFGITYVSNLPFPPHNSYSKLFLAILQGMFILFEVTRVPFFPIRDYLPSALISFRSLLITIHYHNILSSAQRQYSLFLCHYLQIYTFLQCLFVLNILHQALIRKKKKITLGLQFQSSFIFFG